VTPHQPVVSGRHLIEALKADGWTIVRRREAGLDSDDLRRLLKH
jgi:hypothetical protein